MPARSDSHGCEEKFVQKFVQSFSERTLILDCWEGQTAQRLLLAHLPWAQRSPFQSFYPFNSTSRIFNNLGKPLFARSEPTLSQCEGFCHGRIEWLVKREVRTTGGLGGSATEYSMLGEEIRATRGDGRFNQMSGG